VKWGVAKRLGNKLTEGAQASENQARMALKAHRKAKKQIPKIVQWMAERNLKSLLTRNSTDFMPVSNFDLGRMSLGLADPRCGFCELRIFRGVWGFRRL
jgi:hypothetical protein